MRMRSCPLSTPAQASFWPVARGLRPWAGVVKTCLLEFGPCDSSQFPPGGAGAHPAQANGGQLDAGWGAWGCGHELARGPRRSSSAKKEAAGPDSWGKAGHWRVHLDPDLAVVARGVVSAFPAAPCWGLPCTSDKKTPLLWTGFWVCVCSGGLRNKLGVVMCNK